MNKMNHLSRFHFDSEIQPYTKALGSLCPNPYSYVPVVGDSVQVAVDFMGLVIDSGVITGFMPETDEMTTILNKLSNRRNDHDPQ